MGYNDITDPAPAGAGPFFSRPADGAPAPGRCRPAVVVASTCRPGVASVSG